MKNVSLITKYNTALSRPAAGKRPNVSPKESKRKQAQDARQDQTDMLFNKAEKMLSVYAKATGCGICVYNHNCVPLAEMVNDDGIEKTICRYCTRYRPGTNAVEGSFPEEPCHDMHTNAIKEASNQGGSYTYTCDLGFVFWTSPIYNEGRFSGALRGSGYLKPGVLEDADGRIAALCDSAIGPEELARRLGTFPEGDSEKIKSLAEMLLLCAESLSSGSEDYHDILRRRAEQQRLLQEMIAELRVKYPAGSTPPGYPLDKERMLIAALRRGDSTAALHILNEVMAVLIFVNANHFKYIQLRAIELVVLLSRTEINPGHSGAAALETNNRCLRQVQESKTIEELTDLLHAIVKRVAGQISSFQGIRHATALRKAERFIRENFTRKISLQEIAAVSGLSAPYFSTIFKEEMGENLSKYLNRLRVERASRLLLETDLSLSEIAGACCFEDQSWFSKIFKAYTGISPGKYRSQGGGMIQEISEDNLSEDFLKTMQ
jgi:AraC-like DNA-binding protein/ligand-binding sensor protein